MKNEFFKDVHEVALLIPKGRATTYAAIGKYLGKHNGARMVGWAMNKAHANPAIPAHRVVNRNGMLSGKSHFESPTLMQELLEEEGIEVIDNQIVDFETIFWDPSIEI